MSDSTGAGMVKSATRTLDILECVAASPSGLSHGDIARSLGIPKSSLTRLLRSLVVRRYLELDGQTALFTIGPQILPLSRAYLDRLDPVRTVSPIARSLRDAAGEAVTVAILDGAEMVVLVQEPSGRPLTPIAKVGDRAPALLTASGKALAAFLDDREIGKLLTEFERVKGTSVRLSAKMLRQQLREIRDGALATSREEWIQGVIALSLPVFGPDPARPLAALAVALPAFRFNETVRTKIERHLRLAAVEASTRLGAPTTKAIARA